MFLDNSALDIFELHALIPYTQDVFLKLLNPYIRTRGKKFSVKIEYNQGWACKKYRNKGAMKTQEDYPAADMS